MSNTLKQTALTEAHRALNARMVDYAGWDMPVMYQGILDEVRAVRAAVGAFDISHMGRIRIAGAGATAALQALTSNDVAALALGQAQYSLLTNPAGGIIDDIIVYRESEEAYLVIINASNTDKDIDWIASRLPSTVHLDNHSSETAMIAVQGPAAVELVANLAPESNVSSIGRFYYGTGKIAGVPGTFCRTGYTGEDGFELIVPASDAATVWNAVIAAGAVPCGLGARDALRIEAGYPLYGHEINDETTPVEALLMWAVSLNKGEFTGRTVIAGLKAHGAPRKLMGLVCSERIQPRQGYTVFQGEEEIGTVTSGVFSPTIGRAIAMAYIDAPHAHPGVQVEVAVRDKRIQATVKPKKNLLKQD